MDLTMSVLLTLAGGYFGLVVGGRLGEYFDKTAMEQVGRAGGTSIYWSFRMGIAGLIAGIVAGAVVAYFVGRSKKH